MTCRRLQADLIDVARGTALDPARGALVEKHLRGCAMCAAFVERQRAISAALHRLAGAQPVPVPDPGRLNRLLAAFDAPRRGPERSMITVGLSLAASIVIVVSLSVAWRRVAPSGHQPNTMPSATRSGDEPFVLLPSASALPRFEHGAVIRVEIPSPNGAIQADVLVGQDGLARAVRFVE